MPDTVNPTALAEIKISELPVATSATGTDQLEANQAGVTRSITVAQVVALVPAPPTPPTTLPPSGPAGGDLTGVYPNPTLKPDIFLAGDPKTTTPAPGDNDTSIATTAFVKAQGYAVAANYLPLTGGTLAGPGNLAVGGAVSITGSLVGATGFFSGALTSGTGANGKAFLNPGGPVNAGYVAFAKADSTRIGYIGFSNSNINYVAELAGSIHNFTGTAAFASTVPATPAVDAFSMSVTNPSGNTGNIFRLRAGAAGTTDQFKVDMTGDGAFSGSIQAFALNAPPAGGGNAFGMFLGNFTGGNLGLYFGAGNPTLSCFGKKGSIYLDTTGAIPWYNVDGLTTWAQLGGGGASISVGDTPPGSPTAGALWWNSVLGTMFIYYNDGNTTQWVPAAPSAATATTAYAFMRHWSGTTASGIPAATWTDFGWDTTDYDSVGGISGFIFTVPTGRGGLWRYDIAKYLGNPTATWCNQTVGLIVNGTVRNRNSVTTPPNTTPANNTAMMAGLVRLNAGDVVKTQVFVDIAGTTALGMVAGVPLAYWHMQWVGS